MLRSVFLAAGFRPLSKIAQLASVTSFVSISALVGVGQAAPLPQSLNAVPKAQPSAKSIKVSAKPINSFGPAFSAKGVYGKLVWVGGLELESDDPNFGGFSGIAFTNPQHFIAVGDKGSVFSGDLLIENGRPIGLSDTKLKVLPGLSLSQKNWQRDAEGLAIAGNLALVSFEGIPRVMMYGLGSGTLRGVRGRLPISEAVKRASKGNKGLEAIAVAPDGGPLGGAVVVMSENANKGLIQGWFQRGKQSTPFTLKQSGGMFVTDAAFTSAGDLLILERNFSLLGGLDIQLRRIRAHRLKAGHIDKTEILFKGGLSYELDNMEGLAVQDVSNGSSLITLISDDNFAPFQRTLLLQFLLPAN